MVTNNTTSITIVNDVVVTVPESLQFMTTFVLQEQGDWFEEEMDFIRCFVRPGMNVIDIGANYGLYTLSIAKIIGDSGRLWAFEPTEATAICLASSVHENGFSNVELIQSGLSDRVGEATLFTSPNSELNSLSEAAVSGGKQETISLLTLDHCQDEYGWEHIDFIKLDAEGEECNILKAGDSMLSDTSPLIMFELKHGDNINLPLINRFEEMSYESYRLVPGQNTLVPFDQDEPLDGYLLNLFCCKADKAELLENDGFIVRSWVEKQANNDALAKEYIESYPFGKSLSMAFAGTNPDDSKEYLEILNTYILSLSTSESIADRVAYLMTSLRHSQECLAEGEQRIERLVTFSRIAFDAGERSLGMKILSDVINRYFTVLDFEVSELFLPACKRYDNIAPDGRINDWLYSSILEQCIEKHAFSTYFSRNASVPLFQKLSGLGFMSEDMQRRFNLVKTCLLG